MLFRELIIAWKRLKYSEAIYCLKQLYLEGKLLSYKQNQLWVRKSGSESKCFKAQESAVVFGNHYENLPMQYTVIFFISKN